MYSILDGSFTTSHKARVQIYSILGRKTICPPSPLKNYTHTNNYSLPPLFAFICLFCIIFYWIFLFIFPFLPFCFTLSPFFYSPFYFFSQITLPIIPPLQGTRWKTSMSALSFYFILSDSILLDIFKRRSHKILNICYYISSSSSLYF